MNSVIQDLLINLEELANHFDITDIKSYQDLIIYLYCNSILETPIDEVSEKLNEIINEVYAQLASGGTMMPAREECCEPPRNMCGFQNQPSVDPALLSLALSQYTIDSIGRTFR